MLNQHDLVAQGLTPQDVNPIDHGLFFLPDNTNLFRWFITEYDLH